MHIVLSDEEGGEEIRGQFERDGLPVVFVKVEESNHSDLDEVGHLELQERGDAFEVDIPDAREDKSTDAMGDGDHDRNREKGSVFIVEREL